VSFEVELNGFVNRTIERQNLIVRKIVLNIDRSLVKKSPVGNPDLWVALRNGRYVDYLSVYNSPAGYTGGHFRANWQLGVGNAPDGIIEGIDATGAATIGLHTALIPQAAAGKIYYLVNNVPYAERLENGWSTQAPNGMVGLTVMEFNAIVAETML